MELLIGIIFWGFILFVLPRLIEKYEKQSCKKSKFAIRKKPKLLKFYKNLRDFLKWFCNILCKIFIFLLKAVGIIIVIIIICHLFYWAAEHPMGIIIFLLILILLKK